jgi:hypothetical protein
MRRRKYGREKKRYRTVFLLTGEERAKCRPKNLNCGRPPVGASKEQLAEWRRGREEFRKKFAASQPG